MGDPSDSLLARLERWIPITVENLHREYPNHIAHALHSDADVRPPRELTPAFFGCFDWHSAVHSHWQLARAVRLFSGAPFVPAAAAALERSLTPANIAAEAAYLAARPGFERPYGLAWLLQLTAELREWEDVRAAGWLAALGPLETIAVDHLTGWLPRLTHPVRTGLHSQTAFALGLVWDWARIAGEPGVRQLVEETAGRFFAADQVAPLAYEPSGTDFLSPSLAEADLLRRFWPPDMFAGWLAGFLPGIPTDGGSGWLVPVVPSDPADGRLAHLAGLCLSRAWMLAGIAAGLPAADPRRPALNGAAAAHAAAGLVFVDSAEYMLTHWLPSFALYWLTGRGVGGR